MKHLAVNLKKDERRAIVEETVTKEAYAPHTKRSGIGFAPRPWYPGEGEDDTEIDMRSEEEKLLSMLDTNNQNHGKDLFEQITRNKHKIGGLLNALQSRSADFRRRLPIKSNHGNDIEFKNLRKIRYLDNTIGSINLIREKLKDQNQDQNQDKGYKNNNKKKKEKNKPNNNNNQNNNNNDNNNQEADNDNNIELKSKMSEIEIQQIETVLQQYLKLNQGYKSQPTAITTIATSSTTTTASINPDKVYEMSKSMLAKEITILLQYTKAKKYHDQIQNFKLIHHNEIVKERARDIERKRRLLTYEESIRRGPPGDEPSNAYDYYATKIQTQIRRWNAIRFVKWFRVEANIASKRIQTRARGMISRIRWKRLKREKDAATEIQRNYRGMASRVSYFIITISLFFHFPLLII